MHGRASETRQVVLVSSNPEAPSFRHRLLPALRHLEDQDLAPRIEVFPSGPPLLRVLALRAALSAASAVVLAKVKLMPSEARVLRRIARGIIYDVDDAVYAVRPRFVGHHPRRSARRGRRFAAICRASDLVVACNETLAGEARRHSSRVEIVPTPVEVSAYPSDPPPVRNGRTLVWIGMPENLRYLELVRPALGRLAGEFEGLRLRVVCSEAPTWREVPVELVPWSASSEAASIRSSDVGIMPLSDDDWSAGKCAFKILQYMAAGLPCVASPVTMNADVIQNGVNGYLARTDEEWYTAIRTVLLSPDHGRSLGAAGRLQVERDFDTAIVAPRMADLIASVARP